MILVRSILVPATIAVLVLYSNASFAAASVKAEAIDSRPALQQNTDINVGEPAAVAQATQSVGNAPPAMDGLRTDSRWPDIKNCIENTKTANEFQNCLQGAFLLVNKNPKSAEPAPRPKN